MIRKVSQYRDPIMGIAILWIVLHHSGLLLPNPLFALKRSGYGGVDMFLLVSGLGCAYSYLQNKNVLAFYKRRIIRIYPHFIPVLLSYLIIHNDGSNLYDWFRNITGNLTGFCFWSGVGLSFNWYISAILMFYFITPVLIEVLKSKRGSIALLLIAFVASFCFFNSEYLKVSTSRIPIYLLGLMAGMILRSGKANSDISQKEKILVSIIGIIGFVLLFTMYRFQSYIPEKFYNVFYPFFLITPAIMLWVSWLFDKIKDSKIGSAIIRGLSFIGKISLDIYLFHVLLFPYIGEWLEGKYDVTLPHPISLRNILIWLMATICIIAISWGYNLVITEIMKKTVKREQATV